MLFVQLLFKINKLYRTKCSIIAKKRAVVMDKRIEQTREAIHQAFYAALKKKDYGDITIQDILNESNVSRSTFYAHFKSKGEVLLSITSDIFDHVFSHHLAEEKTHDFSQTNIMDYWQYIEHYLYHLGEEKELVQAILSNSCRSIFIEETKEKIAPLAKVIVGEQEERFSNVPPELACSVMTDTILLATEYWLAHDCQETPESIVAHIKVLSHCE